MCMKTKNRFQLKIIAAFLSAALLIGNTGCSRMHVEPYVPYNSGADSGQQYLAYADMTAEEIVSNLSLRQKANQMVMVQLSSVDEPTMKRCDFGCILSQVDHLDAEGWRNLIAVYQDRAVNSDSGVPFIYGQDDVHGVNYCVGATIFPHNIGLGAANDPDLMYRIGTITADEAKLCHMLWNYAPCVAQSTDPRWGRTYESYGSDLEIIKSLSVSYSKGLLDQGMVVCPKHFFGDGNVKFGSGEGDFLIDRGNAELSEEEIEALLDVYRAQIEAGVQTIMVSHSSLNGLKMHENKEYIMYLKNEMGFEGYVCGDWNSVQHTSKKTYYEQVVEAINSGIDMLMEVDTAEECADYIVKAVKNGDIPKERVNDAVRRIIRVKLEAGIIEDPFMENIKTKATETGSADYRAVAERAVEESLVLVKNDKNVLPLKNGSKVYVLGPAMDNARVQCGGWTVEWNESPEVSIPGVTTILDGLKQVASKHNIEVITDPSRAREADVVLLCVGEQAYAEWNGDTEDLDLCGALGLPGNGSAIEEAKKLKKPVVTLIVAGRNVIISDYEKDWSAIVMCYLPGSEGQGVANVLCKDAKFRGALPSPWYASVDQIGTEQCWHEQGYKLLYKE
ncbi:MAG: glycoside hydrolase family 3 protein [Lachnospiraceae bacterium]|nr:glycoside hydrolase family 3 protein [Lachnospiraceae bacterium]